MNDCRRAAWKLLPRSGKPHFSRWRPDPARTGRSEPPFCTRKVQFSGPQNLLCFRNLALACGAAPRARPGERDRPQNDSPSAQLGRTMTNGDGACHQRERVMFLVLALVSKFLRHSQRLQWLRQSLLLHT